MLVLTSCSSPSASSGNGTWASDTYAGSPAQPQGTVPADTPPSTEAPSITTSTVPATSSTTTAIPTTTPYVVPVADVVAAGWGNTHSAYAATDIFLGCGSLLVSPVNGILLEVRRVDSWSAEADNPATRGGRSISILGDDGVRYYMAHFDEVEPSLEPGIRVSAGQAVGTMGETGRSSACHLHFSISPPCPGKEWSVRRGVVWPYPYLDAWERGDQLSPAAEVSAWSAANPDACTVAQADPFALDS